MQRVLRSRARYDGNRLQLRARELRRSRRQRRESEGLKAIAALLVFAGLILPGCRTNESPEKQVNDIEITAQVKSKLASDVGLSSIANISVNSTNGVVTLSGQVDSAEVRTKAEAVAKAVPKVASVVDSIQVAPAGGR